MQDAIKAGLVEETMKIAVIRPVLVVNRKTHEWLAGDKKGIVKLADMLRDDLPDKHFKGGSFKIVLANDTAAIGRVGKSIFQAHGLWTRLHERRQRGQEALVTNAG